MKGIEGEGWRGYMKKVGGDIRRRLEGIEGEGWRGYREKVGGNRGRRLEGILRKGWRRKSVENCR